MVHLDVEVHEQRLHNLDNFQADVEADGDKLVIEDDEADKLHKEARNA